jgi:SAM-dependent methyltransferase/uncharacterized protein YbaR (Trm112 family)
VAAVVKEDILEILLCPYCGSTFRLPEIIEARGEEIITGSLQCECSSFPILEGIPFIKKNPATRYLMKYITSGQVKKAVSLAFALSTNSFSLDLCRVADYIGSWPKGRSLEKILLNGCNYLYRKKFEPFTDKERYFWDLLGNSLYEDYLRHRFSTQTFWSLYPFIPLIRRNKKRVLDVCCGCGHASFVLSRYVCPEALVGVDNDFRNVYLAKYYFSDADFICCDITDQLPFCSSSFSSVVMMDAFHFIDAKSLVSKELKRVTESDGNLLMLHIHNSMVDNVHAWSPVSPDRLQDLFKGPDLRILPENEVVMDFIRHGRLELSKSYSNGSLASSNLILIKSPYKEDFSDLWSNIYPIDDHLIINPLYDITPGENGSSILKRTFPSVFFRKEYPLSDSYLVEKYEFKLQDILSQKSREYLIRSFILINVPLKYVRRPTIIPVPDQP